MGWGSARLTHLVVEAERRAYADRPFIWGPDFWKVPQKADGRQLRAERMKDFTLSGLPQSKSQLANGLMKARTRPITA